VNRLQTEADAGVQRLLTGEADNVAEAFAAAIRAGIAFDLLMEVCNKLLDAYGEIQQMRV
jgi:flagellar hook-basal body complex protein FliE